jgi:SAM-dependent methyltransferase
MGGKVTAKPADPLETEVIRVASVYEKRKQASRRYYYSYFHPGNLYAIQERERALLELLRDHGVDLGATRILDVGCGTAAWIRSLIQWGARPENITGIDLMEDFIATARQLCPTAVTFERGNAGDLKFADGAFDLVLQSTLFTSILDKAMRKRVANEMLRVLRPKGFVVWYDFHINNPRNPDVARVSKSEILRLFTGCRCTFRKVTLAPPIARALAGCPRLVTEFLSSVKFLCTHYLVLIEKL